MLKTMRLISVAAVAALALPALAGSWPPIAPRKATTKPAVAAAPAKAAAVSAPAGTFVPAPGDAGWRLVQPEYAYENGRFVMLNAPAATTAIAKAEAGAIAGFTPGGGDAGWLLVQHKYVFAGGKFVMSDECDHAVRAVQRPTPAEVESARRSQSGG